MPRRLPTCLLLALLLLQPLSALAATIVLNPAAPATVTLGLDPEPGILVDLDADGKLDLVAAIAGDGRIAVLRGGGNGTFGTAASYAVGIHPRTIVPGDLDGDTDPDLVVVNAHNDNVSVLLNDGTGVFAAAVSYATGPLGGFPNGAALADVDGDNDLDLAVARFDGSGYAGDIALLRGNGNGTFQAPIFLAAPNPLDVVAGDFNNDGFIDLASAGAGPNTASILLGNGNGTFAATVNYPTGNYPCSIDTGDLDGDGDLDLVTANRFGNTISILLGNGNGTFAAAVNRATGTEPVSVRLADFNFNGKLDVVVANNSSNNLSLFNGNGNGTLQPPASIPVGAGPSAVAAGDLSGDGLVDLAVINSMDGNASVFRNSTSLPIWKAGYPRVTTVVVTNAQVSVSADRAGAAYLVCLPAGAAAPTSFQVRAGSDATGTTLASNLKASVPLDANTSTSLYCTSLTPGANYDLYTVAADSQGSLQLKPATLPFLLQTTIPGPLTVPAADSDGGYTVRWGASTTSDVTYVLHEATNATFTTGLRQAYSGTATSASITGRNQNVTYYYRVRATKPYYGASDWRIAASGCAVPGTAAAGTPASISVPVADADGAYTVSWGVSATTGALYELQEATSSNFSTGLRTAYRGAATTVNISGRGQNATYYYRVRAVKAGLKDSGYRSSNSCAVPGTATAGIPASISVPATDANGAYTVSWGASATTGTTYELQEASSSNFSTGLRLVYRGTARTANITGRIAGTTYWYRVRAVKGGLKDSGFRTSGNGCLIGP